MWLVILDKFLINELRTNRDLSLMHNVRVVETLRNLSYMFLEIVVKLKIYGYVLSSAQLITSEAFLVLI